VWKNPKYYGPDANRAGPAGAPDAQAPPAENGRRLATFDRKGPKGERAELRVSLDEYQGHPYISVRLWTIATWGDGGWFPTRKGISIRLGEAEGVAAALAEAVELVGVPEPRPSKGGGRQPLDREGSDRTPAGAADFDEFGA